MSIKEQRDKELADGCICSSSLVANKATGDEPYNLWMDPECPIHGIGTPAWEEAE